MRIIVIAGPNGAGKTTFAREYLKREGAGRPFVNGDDIAARLNPKDPAAARSRPGESRFDKWRRTWPAGRTSRSRRR